MSIIETAIAALAKVQRGSDDWVALDEDAKGQLRREVRAVLQAVHEPDAEMAAAGAEIVCHVSPDEADEAYRNDAVNTWRFMIDAALSER